MNTRNNKRSRETVERIIRAMFAAMEEKEKPLDKITVKEICERAQINRSSFYAHFQDVREVMETVEQVMATGLTRSFLDSLEEGKSIWDCFEHLFGFIKEHREFYAFYLKESHHVGVIGVAWELLQDRREGLDYHRFGLESAEEMAYQGEFFLHGMTAMVRHWLERDCQETPYQLVGYLTRRYSYPVVWEGRDPSRQEGEEDKKSEGTVRVRNTEKPENRR